MGFKPRSPRLGLLQFTQLKFSTRVRAMYSAENTEVGGNNSYHSLERGVEVNPLGLGYMA